MMQRRTPLRTIQRASSSRERSRRKRSRRERSRSPPLKLKRKKPDKDYPDAVIRCDSVRDFLRPECEQFKGMLVARSQKWDHVQHIFDQMHDSGVFGEDESLTKISSLADGLASVKVAATVRRLLSPLSRLGMPADLAAQIQQDAVETSSVVAELLPDATDLMVTLELLRQNICARWHKDNYVARAIVSYNCSATEYVHDDFVDFEISDNTAFERANVCSGNVRIVQDRRAICSAGVGSILFIKGNLFPSRVNGLVHKAPAKFYCQDGSVATRLVLKIDVSRAHFTLR